MKPLSAIALCLFLVLLGLTWVTWITASAKVLGIFALIAVVVILVDTFWFSSDERWRARRQAPPA